MTSSRRTAPVQSPQPAPEPVAAAPERPLLRPDPVSMRALQRAAGNRAVGRALARARLRTVARCAGPCTCGGRCHGDEELVELPGRRALARAVASTEAPTGLLAVGSRGDAVAGVQSQLNATGITPQLAVDGVFGARTKSSVQFFQESHRLVIDGIVGRETHAMLDRESALHGGPEREAGGLGPCHTPDDPGPDDQSTERARPEPVAGGLALNFAFSDTDADGGGGGGGVGQQVPAVDLVVQLTSDNVSDALATAYGTPVKITSVSALRDLIAKHKNVGRLTIISHALTNGEIVFEGTSISTITLGDLANKLRGAGTVREIVFLGCTVGNDATGLDDMKNALGSVSAEGSTCHHVATRIDPPSFASVGVVDSEEKFQGLSDAQKKLYAQGLRQRARENHGDCIIGFKPNQTLAKTPDAELRAIAMRNKGMLVAEFTEEDGACWQNQKYGGSGACRRVQAR